MNILLLGDLSWVTSKFCDVFKKEKHTLILANANSILDLSIIQGVKTLHIDPADENFVHHLGTYHFNAVIYFAYREEMLNASTAMISTINSVAGIKNALSLADKNKDMRFFLISSSEVLPSNGRNTEEEHIQPETVNGYALQALENTCDHFANTRGQPVNIVRVPYLFDEDSKTGLLFNLLTKATSGEQIELPSKQNGMIQFLHTVDLAEFLHTALEEPYNDNTKIIHLFPGENQNWFEMAEWIKAQIPGSVTAFKPSIQWRTSPLAGTTAKKFFDWSAKRSLNAMRSNTLANLNKTQIRKPSIFSKIGTYFQSKSNLMKWIELLLGALLVQALVNMTSMVIMFRQLDYRLLYVVIMGTVYGTTFGILSAFIAIGSALYSWTQYGYEWSLLVYNVENWLPFTLYFIAGAVTGYYRDYKDNEIKFQKTQIELLSDKYQFLYNVFDEITRIKEQFRDQLMGYRDSFGRIYKITTELDTLQEDEVLYRSMNVLEDILRNDSIAIYTIDRSQKFARMQLCSRGYVDVLDKSLNLENLPALSGPITEGNIYQNQEQLPGYPSIFIPIYQYGKTMAAIAIWKANLDTYSLYYQNLVSVVTGLVRSSLVRAIAFSQANVEKTYLPNTNILRSDAFEKIITLKEDMKNSKIANFELLKVQNGTHADPKLYDSIKKGTRDVDYVGERKDGNLYILLSQTDNNNARLVVERLGKLGVTCQFANGS